MAAAAAEVETGRIQFLGGHDNAVLCVSVIPQSHESRIVAGGELGQLVIWSGHDQQKISQQKVSDEDILSIACSRLSPDQFYLASGNQVHLMDMRQLGPEPVKTYKHNDEEINQLSLNKKENFLAAADDSGSVKIIDLGENSVYRTLSKHENICAAVRFDPCRTSDLFSGAYDCSLIRWNYSKSRTLFTVNMRDFEVGDPSATSFRVSPPFIHSLDMSADGNTLACALEDGFVRIFDTSSRRVQLQASLSAHGLGASQVLLDVGPGGKFMMSAGNDNFICLWDMDDSGQAGGKDSKSARNARDRQKGTAAVGTSPPLRHKIEHPDKINCIATGQAATGAYFVVVADNSPNLTSYMIAV